MGILTESIANLFSKFNAPGESLSITNKGASPIAKAKSAFVTSLFANEFLPWRVRVPAQAKSIQSFGDAGAANGLSEQPGGSHVTIVDLGDRRGQLLERKPDVRLLRAYAENSVWVRAAIDYYRRTAGRAHFEIVPLETIDKPTRRDKQVKLAVENLLSAPNPAGEPYGAMKEQLIEDYLVIGHGAFRLDLLRDLSISSIKVVDAAYLGFVKAWDGTDPLLPRYCEFDARQPQAVKRFYANEEVMCLVNRQRSYSHIGFSHVEALDRTVTALLSGDDFMIEQLMTPVANKMIDLGEGATKLQVEQFKFQLQQVSDRLAVIGGTKNTKVHNLSASADEMRILDGQQWFVRQVAAVFGISTAKLKLAVDTSRANTEAMYDDDLEAISGELIRLEELETATFINRYNDPNKADKVNLKFFYPVMHRKDEKAQATIAKTQTGQPWASVNEARYRTGEDLLDQNEFPFANEPVVMIKGNPVPYSIWTAQMVNTKAKIERGEDVAFDGGGKTDNSKNPDNSGGGLGADDMNADGDGKTKPKEKKDDKK